MCYVHRISINESSYIGKLNNNILVLLLNYIFREVA